MRLGSKREFPAAGHKPVLPKADGRENTDKPTRAFVRDKINDAAGLIQAILLRGSLQAEAEQIVLIQRIFLIRALSILSH